MSAVTPDDPLLVLCRRAGGISNAEVDWLHVLVAVWQLIADLSFSDLLLTAPMIGDPDGDLLVVAQVRPDSSQTLFPDDHVGSALLGEYATEAIEALQTGRIQRGSTDPRGVQRSAIPVRIGERIVAVIVREGFPFGGRRVSALEEAYQHAADALLRMIAEGTFPFEGMDTWESMRVSDGLMQVAPSGIVTFASPNAVAAHRRLGTTTAIMNTDVAELPGGKPILNALNSCVPLQSEVELGGAVVERRLIPFILDTELLGGMILVRDVTEVRRRDRMLMYKDAVIREIHHRVKNNLQTIASLLRLQARRMAGTEAAEALEESVRRVATIALVHETLSQSSGDRVDFGEVLRNIVRMLGDGLGLAERNITCEVEGELGQLSAGIATPLSLVITELLQNAAEHAFTGSNRGTITVRMQRTDEHLEVVVDDNGVGIPDGFDPEQGGLGLRIVNALVTHELQGELEVRRSADVGSEFVVRVAAPD